MQLPNLTHDQIRARCTEQSFTRGLEYFHAGAIGNPVLHGWTLSATCQGTGPVPYRVTVEFMPTTIAATSCSCPYEYDGECKHVVALLLTYIETPEIIYDIDTLLATLAEKPKSSLLQIISELLKRDPTLAPVVSIYADMAAQTELDRTPTAHKPTVSTTIQVYSERVDRIFGQDFLEQHQLRDVLIQLAKLRQHAESLVQLGEPEFALIILHALIRQSIVRYSDTLQRGELPQFVNKCAKTFAQIAANVQQSTEILEHCRMLLRLSFDGAPVFTLLLTRLLEQLCPGQETADLQTTIEQHLDESPDRQAHVCLLLALYAQTNRTEDYLRFSKSEGENYRLIYTLFTHQRDDVAWKTMEEFSLSVDEYWCLLDSTIPSRIPEFTDKLLTLLSNQEPHTAILLYQKLVEQTTLSRKREGYAQVQKYLMELKILYQYLDQESQWTVYLVDFRKRHSRKRLLLQIISEL